jgi:hypothetical protein
MNTNMIARRLYLPLFYANRMILHSGGPENHGDLFDAEYRLMEEILKHHHLPPLQQNLEHLFNFCEGSLSIDSCEELLQNAGEQYLLSQPKLMTDLLESIRSGTMNIYNGLVEMNVPTYVYFVFICEQFRDGKTTIENVLNDIRLIGEHPILHEMLVYLQTIDEPDGMLMYKELQTSGLLLHNRFLEMTETEDEIRIANLNILEVVGDAEMQAALLVQHDGFNEGEPFAIQLEVAQMLKLVEVRMVDYALEKIMADLQDKKPAYAHVFKAEEYDIKAVVAATCVLVQIPIESNDGTFAPTFRLLELIPTQTNEYCFVEKIRSNWSGDMPPEMI